MNVTCSWFWHAWMLGAATRYPTMMGFTTGDTTRIFILSLLSIYATQAQAGLEQKICAAKAAEVVSHEPWIDNCSEEKALHCRAHMSHGQTSFCEVYLATEIYCHSCVTRFHSWRSVDRGRRQNRQVSELSAQERTRMLSRRLFDKEAAWLPGWLPCGRRDPRKKYSVQDDALVQEQHGCRQESPNRG